MEPLAVFRCSWHWNVWTGSAQESGSKPGQSAFHMPCSFMNICTNMNLPKCSKDSWTCQEIKCDDSFACPSDVQEDSRLIEMFVKEHCRNQVNQERLATVLPCASFHAFQYYFRNVRIGLMTSPTCSSCCPLVNPPFSACFLHTWSPAHDSS